MPNGIVVGESVGVRRLTPTYIPISPGFDGIRIECVGWAERGDAQRRHRMKSVEVRGLTPTYAIIESVM